MPPDAMLPTAPVTLATALAATAVPILVFIVAVKSPAVGAFVRFVAVVVVVTVVIVPAVMFVVLASVAFGNVIVPEAEAVCPPISFTLISGVPATPGVSQAVPSSLPMSIRPDATLI